MTTIAVDAESETAADALQPGFERSLGFLPGAPSFPRSLRKGGMGTRSIAPRVQKASDCGRVALKYMQSSRKPANGLQTDRRLEVRQACWNATVREVIGKIDSITMSAPTPK
jgi:hypothetical protein